MKLSLSSRRDRRVRRVRSTIGGSPDRPRLAVFRSNKHMTAQLIDDDAHTTLLSVSDRTLKATGTKSEKAKLLGKKLGELATKKKIKQVVFDRRQYQYHGRVAALADGAREGGLEL